MNSQDSFKSYGSYSISSRPNSLPDLIVRRKSRTSATPSTDKMDSKSKSPHSRSDSPTSSGGSASSPDPALGSVLRPCPGYLDKLGLRIVADVIVAVFALGSIAHFIVTLIHQIAE